MNKLIVCYVLAYYEPDYIRSQSILAALRRIANVELHIAINKNRHFQRYVQTLKKVRQIRNRYAPDIYIIGFRGHELYWAVRKLVGSRIIIFDAMMSPSGALIEERKYGDIGAIAGRAIKRWEHSVLKDADLVLTDTQLHAQYYQREFGLPVSKLIALPVGAVEVEPGYRPQYVKSDDQLSVLYYGSFLPLHGVNIIIEAASMLNDLPVHFYFIGGNKNQKNKLLDNCALNGVTNFTYMDWVPFHELVNNVIPAAELCLGGPFGNTPQAQRVVTGKTSQCLSLGRPTIIGAIDEDYGFLDRVNCLLVKQGNAESLASSIRWAWMNRERLHMIGTRGRQLYVKRLSVNVIRDKLSLSLMSLGSTSV